MVRTLQWKMEKTLGKFEDAESYIIFGGKFMRKYSLDELPQFLNIILGDMNFIGPRPAMTTKNEQIVQDMRSKRNINTKTCNVVTTVIQRN